MLKLNDYNFEDEVINKSGTVLVDFYADWCGPCKMIAPIVEEIASENPNITVGKINVDESGGVSMAYEIMSIPTLIIFKDGKEHKRIVGYRPKSDILNALK